MHKKIQLLVVLLFLNIITVLYADKLESIIIESEKAYQEENLDLAIENFEKVLKITPANLRVRLMYAETLFKVGEYDKSLKEFEILSEVLPNNMVVNEYLAKNYIKLNKSDKAEVRVKKLLVNNPAHEEGNTLASSLELSPDLPALQNFSHPSSAQTKKTVRPEIAMAKAKKHDIEQEIEQYILPQKAMEVSLPASLPRPESWDIANFLDENGNSFLVNFEYAKFCIEVGELEKAENSLRKAESIARLESNSKKFVEVQILKKLISVYKLDFEGFGRQLLALQPILDENSYNSFLKIFNEGFALKEQKDKLRLSAGIAMGSNHHAIAARLLNKIITYEPDNLMAQVLLYEAQMKAFDYSGAGTTLYKILSLEPDSPEAMLNISKHYLMAEYSPELMRRYAQKALDFDENDSRAEVMLALADYSAGEYDLAVNRLKEVLPHLDDDYFSNLCEDLVSQGFFATQEKGNLKEKLLEYLALPVSQFSSLDSYRELGDDYLRRGSIFSAMRYYIIGNRVEEVARCYLALSSELKSLGETKMAQIASGYGLKALDEALAANPSSSRANLYLAIFHNEQGNIEKAKLALQTGLADTSDPVTTERIKSLKNLLDS